MRRSTRCLEHAGTALPSSHTKVGDLDVLVTIKEEVLGLEVTMRDIEAMAVIHGRDDLLEVMERFVDGQTTARDQVFEQLPAFDVFYNEIPNVGCQSRRIRSGGGRAHTNRSTFHRRRTS